MTGTSGNNEAVLSRKLLFERERETNTLKGRRIFKNVTNLSKWKWQQHILQFSTALWRGRFQLKHPSRLCYRIRMIKLFSDLGKIIELEKYFVVQLNHRWGWNVGTGYETSSKGKHIRVKPPLPPIFSFSVHLSSRWGLVWVYTIAVNSVFEL